MTSSTIRCRFTPSPKPAPGRSVKARARANQPPGPSRAARLLALAHFIERQIGDGAIPDYAAAARALGVTRARLTQVMNLLLLAPEIQARIAVGKLVLTERALRAVVSRPSWTGQEGAIEDTVRDHGDAGASANHPRTGANP